MGNLQCASFPESKKTIDNMENYFSKKIKSNNIIINKIANEYYKIKQEAFKEYNDNDTISISSSFKNLVYIPCFNQQKRNFFMWSKILFDEKSNDDIEILLHDKLTKVNNSNPKLLKELVFMEPPSSIRMYTWLAIANLYCLEDISSQYINYTSLLNEEINAKTELQIKKDLNRTYTITEHDTIDNQKKLYNILKAYSIQDKEIGYCQGMNFIAKFILEVTDFSEKESYVLFSYVLSEIRGFYYDKFPLLNAYSFIFDKIFTKLFPKIKNHFLNLEIPQELWVDKWIQTLFTMNLPYDITCRIWDCLFVYGFQFIIAIVFSLIGYYEKALLSYKDSSDVIIFMKEILYPQDTIEVSKTLASSKTINIDKVIEEAKTIYIENNINDKYHVYKSEYEKMNGISLLKLKKSFNSISLKSTKVSTIVDNDDDSNSIKKVLSIVSFDTDSLDGEELNTSENVHLKDKVHSHVLQCYHNKK